LRRSSHTKALLVFPRFAGTSFWNYRATCDLLGARYPAAPLGLITVAALLPHTWELRLVDRNARELRDEDLSKPSKEDMKHRVYSGKSIRDVD
jgi:hypothetical protein